MRGKKQENVAIINNCYLCMIVRNPCDHFSSFQHKHFYIMTIYTNYKETHVTGFPWPGIKPSPHALEVCNINHWTAREVPYSSLKKKNDMKNNLLNQKLSIVFFKIEFAWLVIGWLVAYINIQGFFFLQVNFLNFIQSDLLFTALRT